MAQPLPKLPDNFDHNRFFRFQAPMMPKRVTFQQYVVGFVNDEDRLWLLTGVSLPQFGPVDSDGYRFQVFVSGQEHDMNSLAGVWNHATKYHQDIPRLYSLYDLGIEDLRLKQE